MKATWKSVVAGLCVAALLTVAYAAASSAGSEGDPLITLSYLNNIFTPKVEDMMNQAVSGAVKDNQAALDSAAGQWTQQIQQAGENALAGGNVVEAATFAQTGMAAGQTLSLEAGGEIIVCEGTFLCSADLVDQTDGKVLTAGSMLEPSHLYLTTQACTVTASKDTVTGTVTATTLNVRSGPGTDYERVGSLKSGATVVVVDDSVSGWYQITCGEISGYVSSEYVTVVSTGTTESSLMVRGDYRLN